MLHVLYVATERRALSHTASATPCMIVCRPETPRPTVFLCVYSLIMERLADGILGVKHSIAAFVIQFLEG